MTEGAWDRDMTLVELKLRSLIYLSGACALMTVTQL